jgi:hypothetical protein
MRGAHTNMLMDALEGALLGAELYKFFISEISKYFRAEPWFACTAPEGISSQRGLGVKEGAGFSITVPKEENAS